MEPQYTVREVRRSALDAEEQQIWDEDNGPGLQIVRFYKFSTGDTCFVAHKGTPLEEFEPAQLLHIIETMDDEAVYMWHEKHPTLAG